MTNYGCSVYYILAIKTFSVQSIFWSVLVEFNIIDSENDKYILQDWRYSIIIIDFFNNNEANLKLHYYGYDFCNITEILQCIQDTINNYLKQSHLWIEIGVIGRIINK